MRLNLNVATKNIIKTADKFKKILYLLSNSEKISRRDYLKSLFFVMNFRNKVADLLQIFLDENPNLFLIDLKITGDNNIRVLLDGDEGVTLEACIAASRQIEHNLNREEQDFSLEVSSAGIGSPLELPRQYNKNKGKVLEAITLEDEVFEGNLVEVNQLGITLEWKARELKPIGKGKVTVIKTKQLPFISIKKARVVIK